MKKLVSLLRNDPVLVGNIHYAAAFSIFILNFIIFIRAINYLAEGGILSDISQMLLTVLGLDAIFVVLIIFMYKATEKLFRIRNAVIISIGTSILYIFYLIFNGENFSTTKYIISFIMNSTLVFYPIVWCGVIIRSLWEAMQERVGGEYKRYVLDFNRILNNKNLIAFSLIISIYAISSWYIERNIFGLKQIKIATLIGIISFVAGFVLRTVIVIFSGIINRKLNKGI